MAEQTVSSYGITVEMPGCRHLASLTVPVTLVVDRPGDVCGRLVTDDLAIRRALWAHVRSCPQAQAMLGVE